MNRFSFLSLILFLSFNAQGSLSELSMEYLKKGSDNESLKMNLDINSLERDIVYESKAWQLSVSGQKVNSQLERSSSLLISNATLQPNDTETTSYNLTFAKEFFTGTKLSLSNTLVDYVNNANIAQNNKGFTQTLSLEQDLWSNFLGRKDSLDLEVSEKTFDYKKQSVDFQVESNLYTFVSDYLKAKLDKANTQLKQEALDRAKKRLSLIKRRVRDGLSEKVDLYSAETQELASRESYMSEMISLQSSLESLSKKVHRRILSAQILDYKLKEGSEVLSVEGTIEENKNYLQTQKQIQYLMESSKKADLGVYPSLVFAASYATNNYERDDSPISDGMIGSDNNEVSLGLTLTWDIGSSAQNLSKQAASIELNKVKMESRKVLLSLKEQETSLLKRQNEVETLLNSASKRLELAEKTLKEYNRLYSRGRATLDQVIRAEEELISTQQSYINYLYLKDSNYSTLAFYRGKLREAILK
ncbi:TolC family protein [Halobacteriovorax marinus]|uniref:TolC family protein n=1 Tax=Halobacteriovorax marinus TaxID=97084 RepID=UPI003A9487BE